MANYNQPFQQPVEEEEFDETFSFVTQQPVAKKEEEFDETFSFVTQPSIQVQPEEEFDETFAFAAGEPSTTQPQPSSPRKLSQRELYADPEFQRVLEFYMRKVGSNEDFFEHMRDAEWNLGSAAMRAYQSGSWDDDTKAAYSYLRDRFHNTKLQGAQEWFQFFKNAGADVLTDPANFAALLFAIPSFGTSAAIRTAAMQASKQALNRFTKAGLSKKTIEELAGKLPKSLIGPARKEMAKRTALYGSIEGAAWTGLYDYLAQSTDINIDPTKDEIDWGQVGLSAGLGATIVGGLGASMGAISGRKYLQKEFDFSNEGAILRARDDQVRLGKVDADTTNLLNANAKFGAADPKTTPKWKLAQRFLGATIGKSTTPFKGPAQGSQTLQELLSKLRYDWDWTLTGAKRAGETLATFGEDLGRRQGRYLFRLERSLNELYREGWFANLSQKDNKHLITLLRNKNTKEIDGKKVSPEVRKAAAQIRPILDDLFKEGKDLKLFSEFQQITDYVPRRFQYDKVKNGQKKLRALVIKYGLADPITETEKKKGILASGKEVDVVLKEQGNVDQEVFGEAATEWLEAWAKGDKVLARKLKAKKIVDDMIEARWTPHELNTGQTGQGYGFLRTRPFHAIPDEELAEFLENDVEKLLKDYIINASAAITRTKFFGKTRKAFETNYMKPIREELEASGMVDDEIGKVVDALRNMHGKVTGTDHLFIKNKYARHGMEWTKLSQQMAHLPLATLSSVTEPLILLSRVGIEDVPYAVGQIGNALVKETAKMFDRTARGLRRGVLRQKVKGRGKDLNQEEWLDLYQTGLALEQATMERIEGMFGTSFHGRTARGLQNFFFKSNLLTQWTSAVQLASFTTGKRLIRSNAKKLFENQHGTKLISRTKQKYYEEQLRDLGLNVDETIAWYRRSLRKGEFDETLAKQIEIKKGVKFYQENVNNAANRFTKEIILNPSTSEANRPLWFSDPSVNILVQFAGYPTVFNNTILKRFVNETYRYPFQVAPKVAMTTLLMTSVALMGNYIRTVGLQQNPERWYRDSPGLRIADAVRRWGGFGPFDYVQRYAEQGERGSGLFATTIKSVTGPAFQDLVDGIQYRKGIFETGINNLPYLNSFIPSEAKKRIAKAGRDIDKVLPLLPEKKQIDKKPVRTRKKPYDKGGYVTNVDNASTEPDEKKVRGQPFTYAELGGVLAQDVEDRRGFVLGGPVSKALRKVLTQVLKKDKVVTEKEIYSLTNKERNDLTDELEFNLKTFKEDYNIEWNKWLDNQPNSESLRISIEAMDEPLSSFKNIEDFISYKDDFENSPLIQKFLKESTNANKLKILQDEYEEAIIDLSTIELRTYHNKGGKARRQARQAERQANPRPLRARIQAKRAEADNKILPIHMRAYLGSALTRIKKGYTINDLDKKERLALYQFMLPLVEQSPKGSWTYDETEGGYRAVTNPMARRQIQKIKKQGFYLDSEGKKVEVTPDYMDKEYEGMDDPINLIEFAQRQGDPTAALEYFLGGADYITDDRGHIIISDEYDFNIGREGQQPSPQTGKDAGRVETFLGSLIPEKNYLYNILQGVGTLVGPAEGKGAPINLDLGTPEYMREQLRQAGIEGYAEGGLVGEMDRLGLAKGGLQKRREARQQDIYDKGYSRFMNWAVDQFTPFGMLGGISNLSNVDADRFPRLHNLGIQTGKLYDTAGAATKGWLTLREGKSREFEGTGADYDVDILDPYYTSPYGAEREDTGEFFGRGKDRREARKARREEEGGWFQRLAAKIRANQASGVKRGAGSIMDRSSSSSILAPLAAQAGPQADQGLAEAQQNVREAKAAHRRVQYAAGGTADLDTLLDDLKTTYDSLSAEEESELQSLIGGREGFAIGGDAEWTAEDEEEAFRRMLEWRSKNIPTKESAKKEYYRRRDELEDHISKNRLVSKEAQMSQMMGEGYRDPRFIATTGNPLIDKWSLHPLAPEGSGQVLSSEEMNVIGPTYDWNIIDTREGKSLLDSTVTGAYLPDTDQIQWRRDSFDINPDKNVLETQIHELVHRADKNSGYRNARMQRLNKKFPDGNIFLAYGKVYPKRGERIFIETLAHSLEHKLSGGKLSDKKLKDVIKLRMTRLLPEITKESTLDKYSDTLNKMIPTIIKDFESYLQELEGREGFSEGGESLLKRKIPAHIRNYLKTVLFGDREPITEKVFNKEEYGRVTKGIKKEVLQNLDKSLFRNNISATFFDTQGRLRDRYGQDNSEVSGSFEPYFGYMGELPTELHNIIGSARYNLKKGDYNTEKLTIDSDQYDFGEGHIGYLTGAGKTEPGLNIDNLRQYYKLLKSKKFRRVAERFANRELPDQETVARWKEEYGREREAEFVPVDMTIPVSDIFSKDEWDNLQRMEGEE